MVTPSLCKVNEPNIRAVNDKPLRKMLIEFGLKKAHKPLDLSIAWVRVTYPSSHRYRSFEMWRAICKSATPFHTFAILYRSVIHVETHLQVWVVLVWQWHSCCVCHLFLVLLHSLLIDLDFWWSESWRSNELL